mmetsp:Transcript_31415/g.70620  ORF Transcript_31415/g.70620 Transcript_31415/m.70620 type:complete len:102 (+) Transcript_31415:472-777(+)
MCEELGDDYFMTSYVEEAAKTSLCRVTSGGAAVGEGCTEREAEYAAKMASKKDTRELERQLARLEAMGTKAMKPELKDWVQRRVRVLRQLINSASATKAEL